MRFRVGIAASGRYREVWSALGRVGLVLSVEMKANTALGAIKDGFKLSEQLRELGDPEVRSIVGSRPVI